MKDPCKCDQPTAEKFVVNVGVVCRSCELPKSMRLLMSRLGFIERQGADRG